MPESRVELERVGHHTGFVDGYNIYGFEYRYPNGEIAWHTTSWPKTDPVHDFWIVDGIFRKMYMCVDTQTGMSFQDMGPVEQLDPNEKAAILKAIADWKMPVTFDQ